jgi:hypothetical protein
MSPRISFSNDFVDIQQAATRQERSSRDAPASSDFEFSVTNYSMMSGADELFFKGRLLPFKDNYNNQMQRTTTLRDELLVDDDDKHVSMRPPKGSTRWKGLLGLKKTHIGSKKADKGEASVERRPDLVREEAHVSKASQVRKKKTFFAFLYFYFWVCLINLLNSFIYRRSCRINGVRVTETWRLGYRYLKGVWHFFFLGGKERRLER